jgi:hypothetical protein
MRAYNKEYVHHYETGGQILVTIGILLTFFDTYRLNVATISPDVYNYLLYGFFS